MSRRRRERVGWIPRIRYLDRDSPLARSNPVAKLALLVGATITVFVVQGTWQLVLMLVALLALFPVARIRLHEFRAATRFFLVFSVLLMVIHGLWVHVGEVVWQAQLGPVTLTVTSGGLLLGLHMVVRFLVVVLGSFLFVATTEPNQLARSLMDAGLPYRAGFALVLALRLMPLMRSESNTVREAQAARGLALDTGGPRAVIRSVRSTMGPLLVSSMSRVDALVISMEGRAFGRSGERTFLREVRWRASDSAMLAMAVLLPLVAIAQRWFL